MHWRLYVQQSAVELIKAYKEAYLQSFGRPARISTRKSDGYPRAYERWVEHAEWLNLRGIAPCVYFHVLFAYLRSKNRTRPAMWAVNLTARDIVLNRLEVQNRKAHKGNPWPTLREAILTDLQSNFDLLREYQKTYVDPARTRQALSARLTPYFWVFDPWYVGGLVQLPPAQQTKVWELYQWFLTLPDIMKETMEAYNELAAD